MIIDDVYDRNAKTGEIKASETLKIQCDRCSNTWQAKCKHYRRHKKLSDNQIDLCISCRNSAGMNGMSGKTLAPELAEARKNGHRTPSMKTVFCHLCGAKRERYAKQISTPCFCSNGCRAKHDTNVRFSSFLGTYQNRDDEVAYLIGMILGDGSILNRSGESSTARIQVSCDAQREEVLLQLKETLDALFIPYGDCPNGESGRTVSFSLPSGVLPEFGLDFSGEKFYAQPYPPERYVSNPNLIVGLVNSDGYVADREGTGGRIIRFSSTVHSIFEAAKTCLSNNGVAFYKGDRKPQSDGWKPLEWLAVEKQPEVEKLYGMVSLEFKLAKQIK